MYEYVHTGDDWLQRPYISKQILLTNFVYKIFPFYAVRMDAVDVENTSYTVDYFEDNP